MRLVNRTVSHIYNRIVPYTIMTQNRFPTVYNFYRRIRNSTVMHLVKFPISVEVETITACNLRCSYCPNSKFERGLFKNSHMMETDVFFEKEEMTLTMKASSLEELSLQLEKLGNRLKKPELKQIFQLLKG